MFTNTWQDWQDGEATLKQSHVKLLLYFTTKSTQTTCYSDENQIPTLRKKKQVGTDFNVSTTRDGFWNKHNTTTNLP